MQKLFRPAFLVATLAGVATLAAFTATITPPTLAPENPSAAGDIKVPAGFTTTIIADDLGGARHMVASKGGDLYVKLSKLKDGKGIYRISDSNGDGVPDQTTGFGDYKGTGVAIKGGYLYATSNSGIFRYKLNDKEEIIQPDQPETIVTGMVDTGRDNSKSIALDDQGIFTSTSDRLVMPAARRVPVKA